LLDQNFHSKQDKSKTEKKVEEAEKRIANLKSRLDQVTKKEREERMSKRQELRENLDKPDIITVHMVESNNQTLSHIALKYYNHATPPYWKYLVEQNKEVLNGSEKNVRMVMKLAIPQLPDELKD
jgi:hypothetical protein